MYDGLKEYHNKDNSGLVKQGGITPTYRQSYAIYLKDAI